MVIVAAIIAAVVIFGILSRRGSEQFPRQRDCGLRYSIRECCLSHVPSTLSSEIALPGNTQAFIDTPIYSRTNGYLKSWYFDIGAHVRRVS